METRNIGSGGLTGSALGLGLMGLTGTYGAADHTESVGTLRRAADLGITVFDTADSYGGFAGERLLGEALADRRDQVLFVTKAGGAELADDGSMIGGAVGRPEYVRVAVDRALRHLGTDRIDLFLQHRVDPAVPVEETFGALAEAVAAGKIRQVGISEAAPATIRRAHAVVPLAAVETEYSLFTRDVETNGVLATTRELGIGFLASSPLGRGMLTGADAAVTPAAADDLRSSMPRFAPGNIEHNRRLVTELAAIAASAGLSAAQLALAWLLTVAPDVVALPGTRRSRHLAENVTAAGVRLSPETLRAIEDAVPAGVVAGARRSPFDVDIQE
jgi:aryl-alcohol dehydrogenase-like predicted oxidoreductase